MVSVWVLSLSGLICEEWAKNPVNKVVATETLSVKEKKLPAVFSTGCTQSYTHEHPCTEPRFSAIVGLAQKDQPHNYIYIFVSSEETQHRNRFDPFTFLQMARDVTQGKDFLTPSMMQDTLLVLALGQGPACTILWIYRCMLAHHVSSELAGWNILSIRRHTHNRKNPAGHQCSWNGENTKILIN